MTEQGRLSPALKKELMTDIEDMCRGSYRCPLDYDTGDLKNIRYGARYRWILCRIKNAKLLYNEEPYRSDKNKRSHLTEYISRLRSVKGSAYIDFSLFGENSSNPSLDNALTIYGNGNKTCYIVPKTIAGTDTMIILNIPKGVTPLLLEELKRQFQNHPNVFEFYCIPERKNAIYIKCLSKKAFVYRYAHDITLTGRAFAKHLKDLYLSVKQERGVVQDGNKYANRTR